MHNNPTVNSTILLQSVLSVCQPKTAVLSTSANNCKLQTQRTNQPALQVCCHFYKLNKIFTWRRGTVPNRGPTYTNSD